METETACYWYKYLLSSIILLVNAVIGYAIIFGLVLASNFYSQKNQMKRIFYCIATEMCLNLVQM